MTYNEFDYREENPNESWDQFIVRKMVEKRKMNDYEEKSQAAYDSLIGKRDDVYPCREDVPVELWGAPIPVSEIDILKNNVRELQEQLQEAYQRIAELTK
jgi:hypothetical protein